MKYVVLGMHKSGTTLISRCFHQSGVNMVESKSGFSYDQGNKFERTEMVLANLAIMDMAFSTKSYNTVKYQTDEPKFEPNIISDHIEVLIHDLNQKYEQWGFKDPRTCMTYRFWRPFLGEHYIIGVFRSPWTVTNHYFKKRKLSPIRLDITYKALKAWFVYNQELLDHIKGERSVLIDYRSFMSEENSVKSLSEKLGFELKDLRNKNLNRSSKKITFQIRIVKILLKFLHGMDVEKLYKILLDKAQ